MENLQPKLRFPEFREDWKLFKINDVGLVITGTTPSTSVKEYYNGSNLFLSPADIDDNRFVYNTKTTLSDLGFSKTRKLKPNSIAFVCIGSTIGKIAQVKKEFSTNQQINSIEFKNDFNEDFSYYTLLKESSKIKLMAGVQTVPQINKTEFSKIKISYPTLQEQTKIANFLGAVDKQLDILNQKKEKLTTYKKGVMQQLFSQQIRFKDDNGNNFPEWEDTKIGEVCQIKRGASPRPISNPKWFDENSKIGWVRISDVTKSKNILQTTTQYLSEEGISKSRLVKKDNLIMSICATIGKPIYTGFDVCIHDGFVVFENLNCVHQYLFYYLDFIQEKWYKYGQPGTQINLNSTIVSDEYFPLPKSLEEQTKIAEFLSAIDVQIEAVENQITKTETYKKGLLQQMFV